MIGAADIRALNSRLGAPGRMAAVLLVIAIVAFVLSLRGLGGAFVAPSARQVKSSHDEKLKQLAGDYTKNLEGQIAQFTGRSVFFIPSAPVPPPPPPPEPTGEEKPPAPPPPPSVYGGPKLIAMVNGEAWFDDGQKLQPGAEGKNGLKLKELKAPWDVAVVWKDVDFNVSLFDRDKVVYPPPAPVKVPDKEPVKTAAKDSPDTEATEPTETAELPKNPAAPESPKPDSPTPDPDSPKPDAPKPEEPRPAPAPEPPKPDQP